MRSASTTKRRQSTLFRELVEHARAHVPMWKEPQALSLEKSSTADATFEIARLPVTSSYTYAKRPAEEYVDGSTQVSVRWRKVVRNGVELHFLPSVRRFDRTYDDLVRLRFLLWRELGTDLSAIKTVQVNDSFLNSSSANLRIATPDYVLHPDAMLTEIRQFRPDAIEADAAVISDLAEMSSHRGAPLRISYAVQNTVSTDLARTRIREQLGAELYSCYELPEFGVIAMECAQHDGLHVYSDLFIIEVLDEHGTSVREGEEGRIVITDLMNRAMPFIRYDTGDRAVLLSQKCRCGIEWPRLRLAPDASS